MGKKLLIITAIVIAALFLGYIAGAWAVNMMFADNFSGPGYPDQSPAAEGGQPDPIMEQIAAMSLEEKIGQLVMVGIEGYTNDADVQELIEKYHVGGFILLKQNVRDARQMLDLLNSLKETNSVNRIPLFLALDEEGGRVSRMPDEFMKLPPSGKIGQADDPNFSYEVGSILGEELRAFGFNMNFAPVLDINSNPQNPVIGDRAFGADPESVIKSGIPVMKGIRSQNVISVVKHFPGHGDTSADSHVELPIVHEDLGSLEDFELLPFEAAIQNQAEAVMVAHILLPGLDPQNPASFSKAVITGILREKMNFEGLVITDDLTMGAVTENFELGWAAVESIKAGSDLVLVCHDYHKEAGVLNAIKNAVSAGEISENRIDESVARILKLKRDYAVSNAQVKQVDPQNINKRISALGHRDGLVR